MNIASPSMQTLAVPAELSDAWQTWLAKCRDGSLSLPDLMNVAAQLQSAGHANAAIELYEVWVAHQNTPLRAVALYNQGTLMGNLRRHADAEAAYRRALEIKPDFAQAQLNLGHQLEHQGRSAEALAQWLAVAEPSRVLDSMGSDMQELTLHALNNMARLLEQEKRYDESEARMKQSLLIKPAQSDVLQHYVHIRQKQCEWPVYQPVGEVTHNQMLTSTSLLSMLSASDDPALQLMVAQRFVHEKVKQPGGRPLHEVYAAKQPRSGKIKIGYLSGDLCMHAVGLLTAELFELHDRERFEVYAYSWSREDGTPLRQRIVKSMDKYVRLTELDDTLAAHRIAMDGVDVLVDLQGLTSGARPGILAHRPAPVQVSYLGLPATSALPGVDWIIADRFVMPPEYLPYCTERPMYVPRCYQVSDRTRPVAPMPTRARYDLPEDAFVFCSFNNNHKVSEEMFGSWMRILQQVPGSVLWLLADNAWAKQNLIDAAAQQGITAERLIFAPRVTPAEYLARFALADLVLDTFPYNAGTTANDCLFVGTPILTRAGKTYISRMAGSLLTAVGLPDLITFSQDEYETRAIQIGQNPARVASYKRYLADHGRQSALFDIPGLVRDIEAEFERHALAHRAGPAH